MVESTRDLGGKVSHERRYYLCSMTDVTRIALTIRHHWTIENQQHWILDVQFGEDAHRTRKDHSAANLGLIRPLRFICCNRTLSPSGVSGDVKCARLRFALSGITALQDNGGKNVIARLP